MMKKLEIATNTEWIRVFSSVDFEDVEDCYEDQAADCYINHVHNLLMDEFETVHAKGQRKTCHGWNGANTFKTKIGPVGTFEDLTKDEIETIYEKLGQAEHNMRLDWVATVSPIGRILPRKVSY